MACPGGCLNGGAQLRPDETVETGREMLARLEADHRAAGGPGGDLPEESSEVAAVVATWPELGAREGEACGRLLYTQYRMVEKMTNGLAVKW
jgi:hypothetical protein